MVTPSSPVARLLPPTALALALHARPGSNALRVRGICLKSTDDVPLRESSYHTPVMCAETVDWLVVDPTGVYVDGTLGGGGHSAALLKELVPHGGHLIGVDRDPDALASAGKRLQPYLDSGHLTLLRSNFGALRDVLFSMTSNPTQRPFKRKGRNVAFLDGLLLDLGVSSHQLDEAARGFSYMRDGPLDMRMDKGGTASAVPSSSSFTASTICNEWDERAIADVIWKYGGERESRRIARSIVKARPLQTTGELAAIVQAAGTKKEPKEIIRRQARVFQALRIEVNQEMAELESVLHAAALLVKPGGRIAIMSYHSLEDQRAKRLLRAGTFADTPPPQDAYGNVLAPWKPLTRQAIVASDEEVDANTRARSARLRIGQRTEHDPIISS